MYPKYKIRGLLICAAGIVLIVIAAGGLATGLWESPALPMALTGAVVCASGLFYQFAVPRRLRRTRVGDA